MNESRNSSTTDTISPELQSWMDEARKCSHMKYARYSRELLQTLPTAAALRLLRAQMQREPRYAGREIPESTVLRTYENLVPLSVRIFNGAMPDPAEQLKPKNTHETDKG